MLALASRNRNEQQLDIGGFVDSRNLGLRVPKIAFLAALSKLGERMEVNDLVYRITPFSSRQRAPLNNLSLSTTDE